MSAKLKAKFAQGAPAFVVNSDHPSPSLVETMGGVLIDAVFIDCEQGSADFESVENMIRAAKLTDMPAIVRLFSHEDWIVERMLCRGAEGLVIPKADTTEKLEQVVAAVRDHFYPNPIQDRMVIAQIETREGFAALPDLLRVDGVDVYFLGPIDVAKSLGHQGNLDHPEVVALIDGAIKAIRGVGKVSGILVDFNNIDHYANKGVQFLYGHVNELLMLGAQSMSSKIRTDE